MRQDLPRPHTLSDSGDALVDSQKLQSSKVLAAPLNATAQEKPINAGPQSPELSASPQITIV